LEVRCDHAEGVTSGQCSRPVPALTCVAGNGWVRSSGESPRVPVPTGCHRRGKAERVNVSEPVVMPRYGNSPGRVVMVGMTRSGPLRIGRRRPSTDLRSREHRCSRGIAGTRPGRNSCVGNVETPSRSGAARWAAPAGRPSGELDSVAGTGRPRSQCRWPKGNGKAGAMVPVLQPDAFRITGRIPGLVPGRESGLT
jgi:hypothetical protein